MATSPQAAVTPAGIRDGDPSVLAALVERRATAVLAYGDEVLPPGGAEHAAAEAFARFRAAVAASPDPRQLDPEALLLGATRHAVAGLTDAPADPPPGGGLRGRLAAARGARPRTVCAQVPDLLAGRAEGALSAGDEERLARHLERHEDCRQLAERVARGEAAYADPPARTVPVGALNEILVSLAGAAPVAVGDDDEELELVYAEHDDDGSDRALAGVPAGAETQTPTSESVTDLGPPADDPPAEGELADDDDPEEPEPATQVTAVAATAGAATPVSHETPAGADEGSAAAVGEPLPGDRPVPGTTTAARGVPHPRPERRHLVGSPGSGQHGVLFRYVLPAVMVAAALVAVMAVVGVFSGSPTPAASTGTLPAAPPAGAPPVVSSEAEAAQREAARQSAAAAERIREAQRRGASERDGAGERPGSRRGRSPAAAPSAVGAAGDDATPGLERPSPPTSTTAPTTARRPSTSAPARRTTRPNTATSTPERTPAPRPSPAPKPSTTPRPTTPPKTTTTSPPTSTTPPPSGTSPTSPVPTVTVPTVPAVPDVVPRAAGGAAP